jgi:hypothetical protein
MLPLLYFFSIPLGLAVHILKTPHEPKPKPKPRNTWGTFFWLLILGGVIAMWSAPPHARASEPGYEAACRDGTMDAASMTRFYTPGFPRKGYCFWRGKYGYQYRWQHGSANAQGDCKS